VAAESPSVIVGTEAPPWHCALAHCPSPALRRSGKTPVVQLTAHGVVGVPPPASAAGGVLPPSDPATGGIVPASFPPVGDVAVPELPPEAAPLEGEPGPDDGPVPDGGVAVGAGSGGMTR
jgi:hypothetical protein